MEAINHYLYISLPETVYHDSEIEENKYSIDDPLLEDIVTSDDDIEDCSEKLSKSTFDKEICLVPGTRYCIGSIESRDQTFLTKYDIRLIVVLLAEDQRSEITTNGVIDSCYRINSLNGERIAIRQILYHLIDMPGANILPIVEDVYKEISQHIAEEKEGNILFHCMAGISRSPSTVIGAMMYDGMSYHDAFEKIIQVRDIIEPDPCFAYQLASLDKSLKKLVIS